MLPSLSRGVALRKVVIGVDTSGSINQEQLNVFIGETRGILSSIGVQEAHIVYCDARIHDVHVVRDGEHYLPAAVGGGGGTSFDPVFEYAKDVESEALVYFTDRYCSVPEQPEFHTVWAATSDVVGPFGTTIKIED